MGIVWIKWAVTHRDYDKIDLTKVQHGACTALKKAANWPARSLASGGR